MIEFNPMTQQEYRQLIEDYKGAARFLDFVRLEQLNFCLPPDERPSDEHLELAEEAYAKLARIVNSVRLGLITVD